MRKVGAWSGPARSTIAIDRAAAGRAPAPIPAARVFGLRRERRRRAHPRREGALHDAARRLEAAIEKTAPMTASQTSPRIDDVAAHARVLARRRAGGAARGPNPSRLPRRSRGARDRRGGATGRPRCASGKARISRSAIGEAEHPVAQEFEPLVVSARRRRRALTWVSASAAARGRGTRSRGALRAPARSACPRHRASADHGEDAAPAHRPGPSQIFQAGAFLVDARRR